MWERLVAWWNAPPKNWWECHHPNCGTQYRGCDPHQCPKHKYEATGKWDWKLMQEVTMLNRARTCFLRRR